MEGEVARSGTRIQFGEGRSVGRERAFGGVEAVDQDFVEAEIGGEDEAIIGGSADPVGVRAFLALFVDAGAGVLHESGGGSEAAAFANRKHSDAPAVVISDQDKLAGFVERDVTRTGALRRSLVEQRKLAAFGVDRKRTDRAAFLPAEMVGFVYRVEIFAAGVRCKERRIFGFSGDAESSELADDGIEQVGVNPFASGFVGVGADVDEVRFVGRALLCRGGGGEEEQRSCGERQNRKTAPAELHFFSSSFSSWRTAAAATESSSSRRSRRTPCVERPASRISLACTRMTFPLWVIIITSDSSVTCNVATTEPLRSVVFMLTTPLPPRDVIRYSASGVRFPKPFSATVSMSVVSESRMCSFSSSSRFCVVCLCSFSIIAKSGCTASMLTT